MLASLHHKLTVAGKGLLGATAAERHRVRIRAKRLRYAAEFFQSLYPSAAMQRYIGRLTSLQDALGRLNDASVARRMLSRTAKAGTVDAGLVEATRLARTRLRAGTVKDRRDLRKSWSRFRRSRLPAAAKVH
jgi:CHAD domain-containing protein